MVTSMSNLTREKATRRTRRRFHVRRRIIGTAERPRLTVQKSLRHMYAQLVDDTHAASLAMVASVNFPFASAEGKKLTKTQQAVQIGSAIAAKAMEKGITHVVFDRNHNLYHGRIKAVADGARKGGLQF